MSVLQHIITICLLWVAIIVIAWGTKKGVVKFVHNWLGKKKEVKKYVELAGKVMVSINIVASVGAFSAIILVLLFLQNPLGRNYEELEKIGKAKIDKSFVIPEKSIIEKSNEIQARKEANNREKEAEQDNEEAMEEAFTIFNKTIKEHE